MPGGRGGGRRRRGRKRRGRRVRGFLKPCLLVILSQEKGHGYSLIDQLQQFGFDSERLDPSLVYRALRDMEEAGWVSSHWDDDSQGPKRRVYNLLPEGKSHLEEWVRDLRQTQEEIKNLVTIYEQSVQG